MSGHAAEEGEPIQVVVVDDHPLFREGVAQTLRAAPGIEVVGEGGSAADAIRLAGELLPDVILLDVTMPGGGVQAAHAISAAYPVVKIVMLTASEQEDDVTAALQAGARGYVVKGVSARELVGIVRSVAAGEGYISPALAASMLAQLARPASPPGPAPPGRSGAAPPGRRETGADSHSTLLEELSEREREVLERVAAGDSNKEIGYRLHLTEKTVKHYMTNILQKLQVRNRVEAALVARGRLPGAP